MENSRFNRLTACWGLPKAKKQEVDLKDFTIQEKINGKNYTLRFQEWITWDKKKAFGWSCKIGNDSLSGRTKKELIKNIINHKPVNNAGAIEWYGQGRYMGD